VIVDADGFRAAVQAAMPSAQGGKLITFGIVPTGPETGYGYIQIQGSQAEGGQASTSAGVRAVAQFVEKPDAATATQYVASGDYFWNSGMFLFKASVYLAELEQHHPEMLAACRQALAMAKRDADFIRLDKAAFAACPSDSIDYAVMEKTAHAAVLPISVGWNDVGSWSALWEVADQDGNGNAHHGDVLAQNCRNTLAWGDGRLLALLGLENVVVVDTDDAVLVAHKDHVQDVKGIVAELKQRQRPEPTWHRKVYRPWGSYDSIDMGERFQVKRITVKPGAKLSLQKHYHRAEHWVVVHGTAIVQRGEERMLVRENESVYIPIGTEHRLENPGKLPLQLIEVQSGPYLGEDDIVRVSDSYGRA